MYRMIMSQFVQIATNCQFVQFVQFGNPPWHPKIGDFPVCMLTIPEQMVGSFWGSFELENSNNWASSLLPFARIPNLFPNKCLEASLPALLWIMYIIALCIECTVHTTFHHNWPNHLFEDIWRQFQQVLPLPPAIRTNVSFQQKHGQSVSSYYACESFKAIKS